MRKTILILIILIFTATLAHLASAAYSVNNNSTSIDENYVEGDFIRGRISINFSGQRNADFTSTFGGKISLLNMLRNMSYVVGRDYKCEPESCEKSYTVEDGESGGTTKSFNPSGEKFYGFKIGEGKKVENIMQFKFGFSSNYDNSSCTNQINIDLFDDEEIEFYNKYYTNEVCGNKNYGCFKDDDEVSNEEAVIGETSYCERITLEAAPAYKVGLKAKKSTKGSDGGGLKLRLYKIAEDNSSTYIGICGIDYDAFANSSDRQEADCIMMREGKAVASLKNFNAFVCVEAESSESDYKVRFRESDDSCGGEGDPADERISIDTDYEIYAQPLKYDRLAGKEFNLTADDYELLTGKELDEEIEKYLNKTYGGACPEDGCIIPLKISGVSQQMTLKDGLVRYKAQQDRQTDQFYELEKSEPIINTENYLQLNLDKMKFTVPSRNGTHEFKLSFNGQEIAEKRINVKIGFSFEIGPRFGLIGRPITFVAFHDSIASSRWNFGDGSAAINSVDNKAEHIFTKEGEYYVETAITTGNGATSTKKFKVIVGDAKTSAQRTISDYQARITNLKTEFARFPTWVKTELEQKIKIKELEANLNIIKSEYELLGNNATEEKYGAIVNKLLVLNIPLYVAVTEQGKLPLEIGFNRINANHIAEISGTQISEEGEIKNSILQWMGENYEGEIEFEKIASIVDEENVDLINKYKIKVSKKGSSEEVAYLIVDYPLSSLKIGSAHEGKSLGGDSATYFVLSGETETIEFLISSSTLPSAEELGIYISPVLSDLGTSGKPFAEDLFTDSEGHFRWGFFLVAMTVLIIVFLTLYILLQTWYKGSYEKHLFKNPDDLYNLINFIYNSRKAGVDDKITKEKLKDKKWKSEQISYAFKKIDGKRTGMWEIPLFKFAENKKVKEELERKQGGPIDMRFVARNTRETNFGKKIPAGVKVIAILNWLGAAGLLLLGILFLIASQIFALMEGSLLGVIAKYSIIFGFVFILMAAVFLFMGIGLWKGRKWARMLNIIFAALSVIVAVLILIISPVSFLTLISSLAINSFILFYLLTNKKVKEVFS